MDIGDLRKDITRKYSYLADPKKKKKTLTCNFCVKIAKVGLI